MTATHGEYVCVAGGQVGGHQAEAVIYHATGKQRGAPVYFVPIDAVKIPPADSGMVKALTQYAKENLPESWVNKLDIGSQSKWGRIALADPNHNPLELNAKDGLNLTYDRHGKLKECYVASDLMPDPDFNVSFDVQDKAPARAAGPAAAPSIAPVR